MLIMLTQGKLMEVDDADFAFMSQFMWHAVRDQKMRRPEAQYLARAWHSGKRKTEYAQRLLLGVTDPCTLVDHKDGDTLNNRRENLRVCSYSQNMQNQKGTWGILGYKGVACHRKPRARKYQGRIQIDGRRISLGYYATPEEAARAYNAAALHYFGEFACLNIIAGEEN